MVFSLCFFGLCISYKQASNCQTNAFVTLIVSTNVHSLYYVPSFQLYILTFDVNFVKIRRSCHEVDAEDVRVDSSCCRTSMVCVTVLRCGVQSSNLPPQKKLIFMLISQTVIRPYPLRIVVVIGSNPIWAMYEYFSLLGLTKALRTCCIDVTHFSLRRR